METPYDTGEKFRQVIKEAALMSVFCREHPLNPIRPLLESKEIIPACDLRRTRSGRRVRVTGLVIMIHTPPTKSGKRVLFVTLEDETGLMDVALFTEAQERYARIIRTSEVLTCEGKLVRQGNGLSISITVDKVISELSGNLSDFLNSFRNDL